MLYEIRSLKKIHGSNTILDIEHLEIGAEQVYTLIGPNGAGKTTLLNILAFLDMPTCGDIFFRGENVQFHKKNLHRLRQLVSLVDQYPILFTGSVRKNVEYGLKIRKTGARQRQKIVDEVLDMVGMRDFIDADAHRLSGGETKRVALARALAIEPQVLLCDEPTANVDTENQEILLQILQECNAARKVSLIFATHYLSQAGRLADHTIILQNGMLSSAGRENVFTAVLSEQDADSSAFVIGGKLKLAIGDISFTQKRYTVCLDPGQIEICSSAHQAGFVDTENMWHGRVKKIERMNNEVRITVDCSIHVVVLVSMERYQQNPVIIEEQVLLQVNAEPHMFFVQ
ncbi:MAG: ATP-binding cassette domain-containing protein [Desulfopila sp.]|jgi:tungstate transport system ATP-binding protein|nr:ATP-binding cassette domain-containing protein [Desulfopila sp.]